MQDVLHMPPWNAAWFVKEAQTTASTAWCTWSPTAACRTSSSYFIEKALEQAGIPVLRFVADPVDPRKLSRDNMLAMVEDFIENRVIPNAGK